MIEVKELSELTPSQWRRCSDLTMGDAYGQMHWMMRVFRDFPDVKAILKREGRAVVGWALCIPTRHMAVGHYMTEHGRRNCKYYVQVYVHENKRGRGYGSELFAEALTLDPRPFVAPHDNLSGELFSKAPIRTMDSRRHFIYNKPFIITLG